MPLRVTSINLNGIRAAAKRGFEDWLAAEAPTALLMQEVRADEDITRTILGDEWDAALVPCRIKGRAGVGIAVHRDRGQIIGEPRSILDDAESDVDSGRWVEAQVLADGADSPVRLVSAYFHSGEKDTPKQEAKMAHLPRISERLARLLDEARGADGPQTVVCGDFNIVRSRADIKNWTPNHNKRAGVLDEEIAFLDAWATAGWRDVVRELAGDVQGPYSWWSWRGKAFDNDAGWRIDYHWATPGLADRARSFAIGRAASYDDRFSDHAPVRVDYDA
ncbi:exodeoxyribonuclease III [Actinomyces sp. B33]|uniref:exodeoxyribonuclease III n=1 Tax=Actinomyces sp. B33 TaxID=2942131 RepID=UPI002341407C|nr:exodeoxyribonuclease III [Actinomyces sp. B33]MDC4233697.1 exodeoxyribonuclease III [Actinomyces sp. B33]